MLQRIFITKSYRDIEMKRKTKNRFLLWESLDFPRAVQLNIFGKKTVP
jgi:hypothetical protein